MSEFLQELRRGDRFAWAVAAFIGCQAVVVVCQVAIIAIKLTA